MEFYEKCNRFVDLASYLLNTKLKFPKSGVCKSTENYSKWKIHYRQNPIQIKYKQFEHAQKTIDATGVKIFHADTDDAYYSASDNTIHVPNKERFCDFYHYYAVVFHELGHSFCSRWIPYNSRTAGNCMEFIIKKGGWRPLLNKSFNDSAFSIHCDLDKAMQEIIAELTACFLALHFEFNPHERLARHINYFQSWLPLLSYSRDCDDYFLRLISPLAIKMAYFIIWNRNPKFTEELDDGFNHSIQPNILG